ncbi:linamarin synthase 2, partial [Quercus suber]
TQKPHAVCVPYPSQGHVTPMMRLAKLLHSRGFHITFVNTEYNHRRLIRFKGLEYIKGLPDFQFETIPDGLPPSDSDSDAIQYVPALFSDGVMSFAIKVGEELGIPEVQFWTTSACGYMGFLYFSELIKRGIIPFKGLKNIRLMDLPSFIRTTNITETMFDFIGSEARNCLNSPAIIFNTFEEFEHDVLEAIAAIFPRIYNIGPLSLLERHVPESQFMSISANLWKEDPKCIKWLDRWESNSVVYANYGSVTTMTKQHFSEFAWGLANSKHPFLWIVRPDVVMGDSEILAENFFEETKDRAFLTSWCPQDQVLAHPSIGVFLTHCGWNSTLESVCAGVPIICWPFFADQQPNCRYACTTWGIGMEINHDVKREEIEALVKEMLEGDKGKETKQKALEWKKKAVEATDIGGSSYKDFERLIKEALYVGE